MGQEVWPPFDPPDPFNVFAGFVLFHFERREEVVIFCVFQELCKRSVSSFYWLG